MKALFNFSKDLAISLIPGLNESPIGSFILSQSLSFISDHLFDKKGYFASILVQ